jgi:DNA methylase
MLQRDEMDAWMRPVWSDIRGASLRAGHPAPFPPELAERLIRMFSFAGDIILDRFGGSGSTAVAAIRAGRNSISIEIEQEYLNAATRRAAQEAAGRLIENHTAIVVESVSPQRQRAGGEMTLELPIVKSVRSLFDEVEYRHRDSSLGDSVASYLPEDLYALNRSVGLNALIESVARVLNARNTLRGIKSRRGDSTFGELIPHTNTMSVPGFIVCRGEVATVEIGTEAMIKQIDRVIGDLTRQVEQFHAAGGEPICVRIVGINWSDRYTSLEGDKLWPTNGRNHKHPVQEAAEAEKRLISIAAPAFDEFVVLRFRARNEHPFIFEWLD